MTNLIYPGQLVFTYDGHPGIALGVRETGKNFRTHVYDVFRVDGEAPGDTDTYSYDLDEVQPITTATKDTLTGQRIEYGPYRKTNIKSAIGQQEFEKMEPTYAKFLRGLRKQKWFIARYKDLTPLEPHQQETKEQQP